MRNHSNSKIFTQSTSSTLSTVSCVTILSIAIVATLGCDDNHSDILSDSAKVDVDSDSAELPARMSTFVQTTSSSKSNTASGIVVAQGRLQPEKGIVRIVAIPGDVVESVQVKAGDKVEAGKVLLKLESERLRAIELEAATLKLEEGRSLLSAKQTEADLAVESAEINVQAANQALAQAKSQTSTLISYSNQIEQLRKQVQKLEQLRADPVTVAAIGSIELDTKKSELEKLEATLTQSKLAIEQSIELAELRKTQSERALAAARTSRQLVDQSSPIKSLEKQIEAVKLQLKQSVVTSPIDGEVTVVNVLDGERSGPLPLIEIANLQSMVCVAEVHESDVARVSINAHVDMKSPALAKTIHGKVLRVDRSVGAAQMRFPNPMARSDFRSMQVWIAIDPADTEIAAERLQLQVDVTITVTN